MSTPMIWSLLIPFVVLDVWVELYHRSCFPIYGIPYVSRSKYIRIDRHRLRALSYIQKIDCMYCGYVNGLVHYISVIAAETEKHWCAIRHEETNDFIPPVHHRDFRPYDSYR